jgi:hypothetical protein
MTNKTHIDSRIPGMQNPRKTELFEQAIDEKKRMKEFLWLLKG